MSRRPAVTWDDLPEYPTDEDIGAVVLGPDRKKEFRALATLREIDGMPTIDPFWGGRPEVARQAVYRGRSGGRVSSG